MKLIERPSFLGRKKEKVHAQWNERFGENNWSLIWRLGEHLLDFNQACLIYEDSYFLDSFNREPLWKNIFSIASNVYDNSETNVQSGLDYTIQEASSTHLQDISVRRIGLRRGWNFEGSELVQIRGPESKGYQLMPGIVPFHLPDLIEKPNLSPKWASPTSVESWYQNNKWLALKS